MTTDQRNEYLEILYEKYYDSIFERCYYYVDRKPIFRTLVEDSVQNGFVKALIHYDKFKNYENPAGWISNAAYNDLRSELRKLRRRSKATTSLANFAAEDVAFSNCSLDQELEKRQNAEILLSIFDMLTDQEKKVFCPYFLDDLSLKETSRVTGLSANSVRAAVNRIRKRARTVEMRNILIILGCFFRFWSTK